MPAQHINTSCTLLPYKALLSQGKAQNPMVTNCKPKDPKAIVEWRLKVKLRNVRGRAQKPHKIITVQMKQTFGGPPCQGSLPSIPESGLQQCEQFFLAGSPRMWHWWVLQQKRHCALVEANWWLIFLPAWIGDALCLSPSNSSSTWVAARMYVLDYFTGGFLQALSC